MNYLWALSWLVLGRVWSQSTSPASCRCEEKANTCPFIGGIPGNSGPPGPPGEKGDQAHLFPSGKSVDGKIFKTDGSQGSYEASKATCFQAGGQLASPRSSAENAAVQQIVSRHNKAAYLGMNDIQTEGTFMYINGSEVRYTNWANEEPNNAGGKEDCIEIYLDGKWNDRSCTERRLIVCEF
ncbi:hypothetical protein JRQ81_017398 [Phrynocephalus forsythii]|uniref:C-type lectin domain-containing protein n=1 Tax=Phrynocephalus forsythii TaxID=171643 RepID=A0A9Q0XQX0_9SAUR|nr:hypothetical protein JRQ81_017398 [Phrynocephalus forsythii]